MLLLEKQRLLYLYYKSQKKNRKLVKKVSNQPETTQFTEHMRPFLQSLLDLILDTILISSVIWFLSPQQMRCSQLEKGVVLLAAGAQSIRTKAGEVSSQQKTSKCEWLGSLGADTNHSRGAQSLLRTVLHVYYDPLCSLLNEVRRLKRTSK